jgi:hypothetical protein
VLTITHLFRLTRAVLLRRMASTRTLDGRPHQPRSQKPGTGKGTMVPPVISIVDDDLSAERSNE